MVATTFAAVPPADVQQADAAESFSDVTSDYWASGSIQRLADQGVINGYADGTYGPGEDISRGQVAELLVNAFDLDVDQNAESSFDDLNDDSYSTPFAEAVAEAGLIKGRQDNTQFAAGMDLSRQQLATILVRAFELEPKEDVEANVADIEDVNASHKENVKILAQYDITNTSDGNFRPGETVNRAQFAVFLERAMEVANQSSEIAVEDVSTLSTSSFEVNVDGKLGEELDEAAVQERLNVSVQNNDGEQTNVDITNIEISEDRESITVEHADNNLDGTAGTLVVNGSEQDFDYEAIKINSVEGVTPTEVEVTFNQEVEAFTRNDVTIEGDNGNREFVSNVELAEDGQSATLELYDELTDETTYDVSVNTGEETVTGSFDYAVGDIAEIQVSDQVIKADEVTDIDYKVLTSTGLDVTETQDVDINSTSDQDISDGEVTLEDGNSIFATIEAGDVESDRFKISANASEAAEFVDYTVGEAKWEEEDFEASHEVAIDSNQSLNVLFNDQYGEKAVNEDVTFETLTPGVLIVDENSGDLTPREEGTADVRVTNGDVSEIISVDVVEAAELDGLAFEQDGEELEDNALTLNSNVDADSSADVSVQLQDQYGNNFSAEEAESLTVEIDGDSVELDGDEEIDVESAEDITLNAVDGESGTSTVTVSNEDGSISKSFEVNVQEAGDVADYSVEGLEEELDLNDNEDTTQSTDLEVFPVDENGVKTGGAEEANWTVEAVDGDFEASSEGSSYNLDTTDNLSEASTGEYQVTATIGDLTVVDETFSIVDSEANYEVTQTDNSVEVNNDESLFSAVKDIFEVTQDGDSVNVDNIDSVNVVSDNTDVVSNDGSEFTLENGDDVLGSAGDASLYIDTVVVNGKEVEVDFQVDVAVVDDTAPEITSLSVPDEVNSGDTESVDISFETETGATVAGTITDESDDETVELDFEENTEGEYTDTVDVSSLEDGELSVKVTAEDEAGNESTENDTFTLDTNN